MNKNPLVYSSLAFLKFLDTIKTRQHLMIIKVNVVCFSRLLKNLTSLFTFWCIVINIPEYIVNGSNYQKMNKLYRYKNAVYIIMRNLNKSLCLYKNSLFEFIESPA